LHYNRVFLLGTSVTNPVKAKDRGDGLERWWFLISIRRDEGGAYRRDKFWITGQIHNMNNLANERIRDYVQAGKLVLVEGVLRQTEGGKLMVLAKLIRSERIGNKYGYQGNYPSRRQLTYILKKKK